MKLTKQLIAAVVALAVASVSAEAQVFSFYTTGGFTGASCTSLVGSPAVCDINGSGSTLTFTGVGSLATPLALFAPTASQFGSFRLAAGVSLPQSFSGPTTFTLYINQVAPTAGTSSIAGSLTGTLTSGIQSDVIWTPGTGSVVIGGVRYSLSAGSSEITIGAPSAGASTIEGRIRYVPEPASFALVSAGLAGLAVVARRRRSA
jgi:hypothetical protein